MFKIYIYVLIVIFLPINPIIYILYHKDRYSKYLLLLFIKKTVLIYTLILRPLRMQYLEINCST